MASIGSVSPVSPYVQSISDAPQERVPLTILSYDELQGGSPETARTITKALKEQGIVGIRGIPRYVELVRQFIEGARIFSALPEEEKKLYSPNRKEKEFTGFELGAEVFTRPDGTQVVDDSKASYYALVPDHKINKWPEPDTGNLRNRYQEIGALMAEVGKKVMEQVGLLDKVTLAPNHVGRMLHYRKDCLSDRWCGAHFDHGLFTALLPSVYFNEDGTEIPEPEEAGLYVKAAGDAEFKKVVADRDVMLFQAAEFGQLATNDDIIATEHEVRKPLDRAIERYTMAFFFATPMDFTIRSTSRLTKDARWGEGEECFFEKWHLASLARYLNPATVKAQ